MTDVLFDFHVPFLLSFSTTVSSNFIVIVSMADDRWMVGWTDGQVDKLRGGGDSWIDG